MRRKQRSNERERYSTALEILFMTERKASKDFGKAHRNNCGFGSASKNSKNWGKTYKDSNSGTTELDSEPTNEPISINRTDD